jgi:hypothetical protein
MPSTPKLFLYKARDAPIVVILRRGEKKRIWEMIRWDLTTDEFTCGQWLTKGDMMNGSYAAVSPDGKHFAYHYSEIRRGFKCHAVISAVPYFTALLYTNKHCSNWESIAFSSTGQPMHYGGSPLVKKNETTLEQVPWEKGIDSGYVKDGTFTDSRGRVITTKAGQLFADGELLYDTTDHQFRDVAYVELNV